MAGDKEKKGFSGLSDLASEVSGVDEAVESPSESKPSKNTQGSSTAKETPRSEPERESTTSPSPIETISSRKSGVGSGVKWILGIIAVVFVVWLFNNGGKSDKKPVYNLPSPSQSYNYPQSSSTSAVQTPSATQSAALQYEKPPVGTNNVLSVPKIRWCVREGIRIEAMRDLIDTNEGVDEFNRIVNDYNIRCGSYRYREGSLLRAEREVGAYRREIVSDAIRSARRLGRQGAYASSAPKRPNAQHTREAQQLLTELGYDPGPVDGLYGRRTADAVRAFQRDMGLSQDGWIDERLLFTLRRATE